MNISEKASLYGHVAVCVVVYFAIVVMPYAL